MNKHTDRMNARQPARSDDVRTQDERQNGSPGAQTPLGYRFDPIPQSLRDLVRAHLALPVPPKESDPQKERARRRLLDDRFRDVDLDVATEIIRWWRKNHLGNTCWVKVETIAEALGVSERTVQYALRRLEINHMPGTDHGFIERVNVGSPDPDNDKNWTGYRFVLHFMPSDYRRRGAAVDRRPPGERKVYYRRDGEGGMQPVASPPAEPSDQAVASAPMQPVASAPMQPVASKLRAGASNSDGAEQERETPSSSSLSAGLSRPDRTDAGSDDDDDKPCLSPWGGKQEALDAVTEVFGAKAGAKARAEAPRLERQIDGHWDCFHAAVYTARYNSVPINKNLIGWLRTTAIDYAKHGISTDAHEGRQRWIDEQSAKAEADRCERELLELVAEVHERGWRLTLANGGTMINPVPLRDGAAPLQHDAEFHGRLVSSKQELLAWLYKQPGHESTPAPPAAFAPTPSASAPENSPASEPTPGGVPPRKETLAPPAVDDPPLAEGA